MACEVRNLKRRVCLSGELNIYAAAMLKERVLAALRINLGTSAIDLSRVTEIDTAGLQIILLARRLSMACGNELKLINPSEPAREVLELCGLDKLIAVEKATKKRGVPRSPKSSEKS
jgi:anti-sigma B factor antagonist